MNKLSGAVIAFALLFGIAINGYSQDANPTPTPAVKKKRSFDQFDVSDGVRVSPSAEGVRTPSSNDRLTLIRSPKPEPERVDSKKYASVMRMAQYAFAIEEYYRSVVPVDLAGPGHVDIDSVLKRKLDALYRIIELHRVGLLEQAPLQNSWNLSLLKDNQVIIDDMITVLAMAQSGDNTCTGELRRICVTYILLPPATSTAQKVEKRKLLASMLIAMKNKFTVLVGNVVHDH